MPVQQRYSILRSNRLGRMLSAQAAMRSKTLGAQLIWLYFSATFITANDLLYYPVCSQGLENGNILPPCCRLDGLHAIVIKPW